jgi:hypothetical protein
MIWWCTYAGQAGVSLTTITEGPEPLAKNKIMKRVVKRGIILFILLILQLGCNFYIEAYNEIEKLLSNKNGLMIPRKYYSGDRIGGGL